MADSDTHDTNPSEEKKPDQASGSTAVTLVQGELIPAAMPSSDESVVRVVSTVSDLVDSGKLDKTKLEAFRRTKDKDIEDVIFDLLPGRGHYRDEEGKIDAELYIQQLKMIGIEPMDRRRAVADYLTATLAGWQWIQNGRSRSKWEHFKEKVFRCYRDAFLKRPASGDDAVDASHAKEIYGETMQDVRSVSPYEDNVQVDGVGQGALHHLANAEADDPDMFVKWHPNHEEAYRKWKEENNAGNK